MGRNPRNIPLGFDIFVSEDEYEVIRMIAEGYTIPYISHTLSEKYPWLSIKTIEGYSRRIIKLLELHNPTWEEKKPTYNQSVRIANWFHRLFLKNPPKSRYFDLKVVNDYKKDGSFSRTAERNLEALKEFESITTNFLRPDRRGPFKELPKVEIFVKDLTEKNINYRPSIDFGPLRGNLVNYRYVFDTPLTPGDRIYLKTIATFKDWYSRTQTEHNRLLAKTKDSSKLGFSARRSVEFLSSWHDYNIRGKIDLECRFSKEYPAQWAQLKIYSSSWDRQHKIENLLSKQKALSINGRDPNDIDDQPVRSIRLVTHGLPYCKVSFLWKPYRRN